MNDGPRLADEIAGLAELLGDLRARLRCREPGQIVVVALRGARVGRFPAGSAPRHLAQRAVCLDNGADRQAQLPPPRHVGQIAEGADHGDAAALFRIGERMRPDRHADAEERRHDLAAEQRFVALVGRMRYERDARGDQLGARGLDLDRAR